MSGSAYHSTDAVHSSTYTPRHAEEMGWRPKHRPEHILEADVLDREVEAIIPPMDESLRKVRLESSVGNHKSWNHDSDHPASQHVSSQVPRRQQRVVFTPLLS